MTAFIDRFPVLKWIPPAMAVVGAITFLGGIWWNSNADKLLNERWYREDEEWNDEILGSLADIRLKLEDIEQRQVHHEKRLEHIERITQEEFDELEQDHKDIGTAAWQIGAQMAEALGRHEGMHISE